uniref:Uncharacterized protein n=1 Tax=Populus davidiana TaxID=266767 RepID=A0A6M2ECY5_9ROSI
MRLLTPKMKAVHGKGEINECQAAKNYLHVVPTDCARRLHWAQQLCLGPLAFSTLRKPRKRTCRTNTNLGTQTAAESGGTNTNSGTGTATENDRCDKDKLG